jgi:hypothetical protein
MTRTLRQSGWEPAIVVAFALLAVAGGALASTHSGPKVVAALAVLGGLALVVRRFGSGVWHGFLLVGTVDGLPGPTLENPLVAGKNGIEIVAFILIASLVYDNTRGRLWRLDRPALRWLTAWGAVFGITCVAAIARSAVALGESSHEWLSIGLSYIMLGALVPLFAINLTDPKRRSAFLVTCGLGAAWNAVVTGAAGATGRPVALFVHVNQQSAAEAGITRVYYAAVNLFASATPFALGYALAGPTRAVRRLSCGIFLLCVIGIGLSLVRAYYIADMVAILFGLTVWGVGRQRSAQQVRRLLGRAAVIMAICALVLGVADITASQTSPINAVVTRSAETFTPAQRVEDDVRLAEAATLERALSGDWLFGLGFDGRYYPGLPEWDGGSIEDSDVGVLNVVMVMGILGTVLLYLPFVGMLSALTARRWLRPESHSIVPLAFGSAGFCVMAMVSSVETTLMFHSTGAAVCAAAIGLGAAAMRSPADQTSPSDSRQPTRTVSRQIPALPVR